MNRHRLLEQRSLMLHRAMADKLRADPTLIEIARTNIARWKSRNAFPQPYLDEWLAVLDRGLDETIAFMCEDSAQARRLRQSSPFAGILTPRERWSLLREARAA